ncbi:hypothetical protein [Sphingomonas sp. CLY1604]|uniref:hypothetical protein n=1 Tax=Sphingomonas sp. CLY1604 TaxID=3457786 RepID=UPI003FD6F110
MNERTEADYLLRLSAAWAAMTMGVVVLWWFLSTDLVTEIAWLPPRLDAAMHLDPLTKWYAWQCAPYLQALVATLVACVMILVSVLVGGWSRAMMAAVRRADEFKFVALPLLAAPLGAVLVAAAEPVRRSFADWPGGFNAFPAYFVIWALTLGYMMKLPWDCATELLKERGAGARYAAMKAARRRRRDARTTD